MFEKPYWRVKGAIAVTGQEVDAPSTVRSARFRAPGRLLPAVLAVLLGCAPSAFPAKWLNWLGLGKKTKTNPPPALTLSSLSQDQMVGGLKEALDHGVQRAVKVLGRRNGFLKDPQVRIPMPESLTKVERALRLLRQDKLADSFVTTMNRAAEKAVPEAATALGDALKQMTVADAKSILTGPTNAATQYFRRTSQTNLYQRFYPIVQQATAKAGVTRAYKQMLGKASYAGGLVNLGTEDLDGYVTQKALDGLFLKIAEEEKRIRENPVARTTDLLQKVFGAVRR